MDTDKPQEITGTASIEIVRVIDEDNNEIEIPFDEIDEKYFCTENDDYVQVVDMEFDSSRISGSEYAKFLEFKRKMEQEEPEGSISFTAPRKLGWGVIGGGLFFFLQGLVWAVILYNSQMNFNQKTDAKLQEIDNKIEKLYDNVYTKKEEDLKYENLRLEILKNKEILDSLITK